MHGLSDTERKECKKLLCEMTEEDLKSLSETVTNKMIVVENISEAVEAILSYSKNAEELLRRKKVHRRIIFRYLAGEGLVISPNSEKHELVAKTVELWSSGKVLVQDSAKGESGKSRLQPTETMSQSSEVRQKSDFDPLELGQQFCHWFFHLLNSHNPSVTQQPQDWGPQHFWPDAQMELFSSTSSKQRDEFQGAELVSQRLLALTKDEHLILSPNLQPQGFNAVSSPHGLVVVAVAGTVHRGTMCLGVFEQIFGLILSPLDNVWKIKFIKLKVRGQDSLEGPNNAVSPTLTCDSSELQLLYR